jgi:hypothetical protein
MKVSIKQTDTFKPLSGSTLPLISNNMALNRVIAGKIRVHCHLNNNLNNSFNLAHFPLGEFVCVNSKKVGTDPTFSQQIFSLTNHITKIFFRFASRKQICLVENWL